MGPSVEIHCAVNGQLQNYVDVDKAPIILQGYQNVVHSVEYTIVNRSDETLIFNSCSHGYKQTQVEVNLSDQFNVTKGRIHSIEPSDSCWVRMKLTPKIACGIYLNLYFTFTMSGEPRKYVRKITYDCIPEENRGLRMFEQLAPQPMEESEDEDEEEFADLKLIEFGQRWKSELENTLELDDYTVPEMVKKLVCSKHTPEKLDMIRDRLDIRSLSYANYNDYFHGMLWLEEIQQWRDIRHYTIKSGTLIKDPKPDRSGNTRFRLRIPGLAEKRPSVLRGDKLHIIPLPPQGFKYEGLVDDTSQNDAYLIFDRRFGQVHDVDSGDKFRIEFTVDRLPPRLMHRAVDIVKGDEFSDVVFPRPSHVMSMTNPDSLEFSCFEKRVEENREQLSAVKNIVAGSSRPAPYLIYGPPGTGKTFTLVEAIKQVRFHIPNSRILVCAPQNDAADLIAERLMDDVDSEFILRFNAVSRSYMSMSDEILSISNYDDTTQRVTFPPKSVIANKDIVVSTLVTSGRLVSAELTDHFTHIFIDEAGFATEAETAITLGLLSPSDGQLVLAGDPKQLGAILRSSISTEHGFGESFLERLMKLRSGIYARNPALDLSYNESFVTKLLKNFRSHPGILEIPNQLFYDRELQACADETNREYFCGWQGLPESLLSKWKSQQIGFPLIFHRVDGREEQEACSPSWFNRHEVLVVMDYVNKLLLGSPKIEPEDIGIISPYIQQVRKIKHALRVINDDQLARTNIDIEEIKVGSVEKFQGDEREVIIISTVRSRTDKLNIDRKFNLGFVSNPKRFNVAITRAKALLIIIGNPLVLCTDEKWRRMIQHIYRGEGYVGDPVDERLLQADEIQPIEGGVEQLDPSAEEYAAATASGGRSGLILHQDDQWERKG